VGGALGPAGHRHGYCGGMTGQCTAPIQGHGTVYAALHCPQCGPSMRRAARLPPTALHPPTLQKPPNDVARDPSASPEALREIVSTRLFSLRSSAGSNVLENAANHPNTPPDVLVELATDESLDEHTRASAIRNPNLPSDVAKGFLADDAHPSLRAAALTRPEFATGSSALERAQSPDLSLVEQRTLTRRGSAEMLRALWGNPIARQTSRANLVTAIYDNDACPSEIREEIIDWAERIFAGGPATSDAEHAKARRDIFEWMTGSGRADSGAALTSDHAGRLLVAAAEGGYDPGYSLRRLLEVNDIPEGYLVRAARVGWHMLWAHPAMTATGLDEGVTALVRKAQGTNPDDALGVCRRLCQDDTVRSILSHPAVSQRSVERLLAHTWDVMAAQATWSDPDVTKEIKEISEGFVLALARCKAAPAKILETIGASRSWAFRKAVAGNPATPPHVLKALARTKNAEIARALVINPSVSLDDAQTLLANMNSADRHDPTIMGVHFGRLGVDPDNRAAMEMLAQNNQWWTLRPDSSEVQVALLVHPNVAEESGS